MENEKFNLSLRGVHLWWTTWQSFLILFIVCSLPICSEEVKHFTLDESIQTAIQNNLSIKSAEARVRQAEIEKKDAFTLFLPAISSSFSYTKLNEAAEFTVPGFGSFKATDQDIYNSTFTLTQPVFTGGKLKYAYKQSEENLKKVDYEYQTLCRNISFDVKNAYFSVLKAQKFLEVAKELKKQSEKHLDVAKKFFESGMATKVDVLKTEVFLSEINQEIIEAENVLSLSISNFNFLLNQPLSTKIILEDTLKIQKIDVLFNEWKKFAFENRPELKEFESMLKISGYGIKVAKGDYYPQISLLSNYQNEKGNQDSLGSWKSSWNVMLAFEIDIWNWGSKKYKVKSAKSQEEQLREEFQLFKNGIELEVKNAYLGLETSKKKIETAKKSIEEAEENLRVTNLLYKEGMTTTTEVLDAQTSLSRAKNNYYQALYDYQIFYARLEKASGKGWKE